MLFFGGLLEQITNHVSQLLLFIFFPRTLHIAHLGNVHNAVTCYVRLVSPQILPALVEDKKGEKKRRRRIERRRRRKKVEKEGDRIMIILPL